MNKQQAIIIDCDPGNGVPGANVDDAIAIAFAAKSKSLDLHAIWTVFGNIPSPMGYASAKALLQSLREPAIIVRQGSDAPLNGERQRWIENREHMANDPHAPAQWLETGTPGASEKTTGQAPVAAAAGAAASVPVPAAAAAGAAASAATSVPAPAAATTHDLAADILSARKPINLIAIGPLTNVARVIREEPEAASQIAHIYAMGGALGFDDLVDTNFAVDPQAARIVLEAGIPLTLAPLDVTRTTHLSQARFDEIMAETDPRQAPWKSDIRNWLGPWLEFSDATRPVNGMWIHDLVAVAALSNPEIVTSQQTQVRIAGNGKLLLAKNAKDYAGKQDDSANLSAPVTIDLCERVNNDALIDLWARTVLHVESSGR
ncbi:nucleoside hydrolase [Bifidobacterium sp. ESL0728]|uniref:nucleoside hydrolase n=1 Tax=Bifidobacterium sp. ESL0728 TaxID=2983220 RepID=UPI0023F99909|nr:nucleoside hydrolase [Bifidobacterium sp. ESL0728]WEV58875.1 nucleoside hydrolase [Bifidobacterium sp. ESL0728]